MTKYEIAGAVLRLIGITIWFTVCLIFGLTLGYTLAKADPVTIVKESERHGLDPLLVAAIIKVESNWKHDAIGSSGEIGLMQLHPKFHKDTSLKSGIAYLAYLKRTVGEDYYIVAYNNGPNRRPKYPKLHPYFKKVMREYEALKENR